MEAIAKESADHLRQPLIEIVVESWRMAKLFLRMLGKLEATDASCERLPRNALIWLLSAVLIPLRRFIT